MRTVSAGGTYAQLRSAPSFLPASAGADAFLGLSLALFFLLEEMGIVGGGVTDELEEELEGGDARAIERMKNSKRGTDWEQIL